MISQWNRTKEDKQIINWALKLVNNKDAKSANCITLASLIPWHQILLGTIYFSGFENFSSTYDYFLLMFKFSVVYIY